VDVVWQDDESVDAKGIASSRATYRFAQRADLIGE
jgi:hypothetical protein